MEEDLQETGVVGNVDKPASALFSGAPFGAPMGAMMASSKSPTVAGMAISKLIKFPVNPEAVWQGEQEALAASVREAEARGDMTSQLMPHRCFCLLMPINYRQRSCG